MKIHFLIIVIALMFAGVSQAQYYPDANGTARASLQDSIFTATKLTAVYDSVITITALTPTQLPAFPYLKFIEIVNNGSSSVYIGVNSNVSATRGETLSAGSTFWSMVYTNQNQLWVYSTSTGTIYLRFGR